jgi:hypothetical protein
MGYLVRTITSALEADEQELKAQELELMQLCTRGKHVRDCKQFGNRSCKDRACVSCEERKSADKAAKVKQALRARFRNAHLVTLAVNSKGPLDLARTLDCLGKWIRINWRWRAAVQKTVRGVVGQIEPKLSNRRLGWSPHAHLILDTYEPDLDLDALSAAWQSCTRDRGTLFVPPGGSLVGSVDDVARYITKRQDACPNPGAMSLPLHRQLLNAIKSRRLFIAWGTGLPPKERHAEDK